MTRTITRADVEKQRKAIAGLEAELAVKSEASDEVLAAALDAEGAEGVLKSRESLDKVDAAEKEASKVREELDVAKQGLERMLSSMHGSDPVDRRPLEGQLESGVVVASPGDRFVQSDEWQQFVQSKAAETGVIQLGSVEINDRNALAAAFNRRERARLATTDMGPLVPPDQQFTPPVADPTAEVMVMDLVDVRATGSDTIEYTELTTRTENAAGAAFGTDLPESERVWVLRTVPIKRRGTGIVATRGNLADQDEARAIIDDELMDEIRREAEDQILNGDGVGENFEGILTAVAQNYVTGTAEAGEPLADAIHRTFTVVRVAFKRAADGIVLDPLDDQKLALEKDNNGAYRHNGGWADLTPRRVWGRQKTVSDFIPNGTRLVGAFRRGARLWLRTGIAVDAYNQHSDFAKKGLVLVQGEHRAAFKTIRSNAFATNTDV